MCGWWLVPRILPRLYYNVGIEQGWRQSHIFLESVSLSDHHIHDTYIHSLATYPQWRTCSKNVCSPVTRRHLRLRRALLFLFPWQVCLPVGGSVALTRVKRVRSGLEVQIRKKLSPRDRITQRHCRSGILTLERGKPRHRVTYSQW